MSITYEVGGAQLGHRLAQLRERTGMKQAELARKITWSQAVLSRIEAGERTISDDELTTLLEAIGTEEAADLAMILDRDWQCLPRPPLDHPDQNLLWRAEQTIAALEAAGTVAGTPKAFQTRLDEYVKEILRLACSFDASTRSPSSAKSGSANPRRSAGQRASRSQALRAALYLCLRLAAVGSRCAKSI